MSPIAWSALLELLGPLALEAARWLIGRGCQIDGCPHDLSPRPADIPAEDEAFADALGAAEARVRGLDASTLRGIFPRALRVHLLNRGGARCGEPGGLLTEDVTQMTCAACVEASVGDSRR